MTETPRERAEQRSQQPEEIRPNPESQSDPPQMPTYEEQHEHEAPGVSAEDIQERIGERAARVDHGSAEGQPDPGVEQGPAPKTGREGGVFGGDPETDEAQVGHRPVPGE
ncbi:MAG: hypothetical protein M3308_11350 [Actinomycetota bacterium]|nr:hypothetical protein [Actinomycetota bacterium]